MAGSTTLMISTRHHSDGCGLDTDADVSDTDHIRQRGEDERSRDDSLFGVAYRSHLSKHLQSVRSL